MSFLRAEAKVRVQGSPLLQLKELLDWEALRGVMGTLGRSGYGPTGYCPVKLLKSLILQAWHSLSDPALKEARVRLDFMLFTGFETLFLMRRFSAAFGIC